MTSSSSSLKAESITFFTWSISLFVLDASFAIFLQLLSKILTVGLTVCELSNWLRRFYKRLTHYVMILSVELCYWLIV